MLSVKAKAKNIPPERTLVVPDFVERIYLPWVEEHKRPSTLKSCQDIWKAHLKPILVRDRVLLRDVRTSTVQNWLNQIGQQDLSKNSLKRIQSLISGIFSKAKQLDYYEKVNPVQNTEVNPKAADPQETCAYSLDEEEAMLRVFPEPAATVFAVAAYAGLRRGEITGLDWSDWREDEDSPFGALWVSRSVWNGHVGEPKTKKSKAPVPVIPQLAKRLAMYRERCGSPAEGPMFANTLGGRMHLNNLLRRVMLPALNRCRQCGGREGKSHLRQDHAYERDTRIPQWHGWHAARRGLGTNLYHLGVSDKVIQRILRHSNVNVTMSYYVKPMDADVLSAMAKLEQNVAERTAAQALRDSDGTVNPPSGATPDLVN